MDVQLDCGNPSCYECNPHLEKCKHDGRIFCWFCHEQILRCKECDNIHMNEKHKEIKKDMEKLT